MDFINYIIKDKDIIFIKPMKGPRAPKNKVGIADKEWDTLDWQCLYEDDNGDILVDKYKKEEIIKSQQSEKKKIDSYADYLSDVDKEMKNLFGSTNRDKANSMFLTWKLMMDHPSHYIDKGLTDQNGDPLDTVTKVYEYANMFIMKAVDYSVFLMKREDQYRLER